MYVYSHGIFLSEVPKHVSLGFLFCGCQNHCVGCHSPHLHDIENGTRFELEDFQSVYDRYKNNVSCILFFGGEWFGNDFLNLCQHFNTTLPVCLYTGLEIQKIDRELLRQLHYIKTGAYRAEFGPIDNKNTNQKFYELNHDNDEVEYKDLTKLFWKF